MREISNTWSTINLEKICTRITKGGTPTTYGYNFQPSGINFIKIENITNGIIKINSIIDFISQEAHEYQKKSQLHHGNILFSIAGTIGQTCIVKKDVLPANTNQALAIIQGFNKILSPEFLKFQLDSFVARNVTSKARGGAMNNVSLGDLKTLNVLIPPLPEQRAIVAKIEELFNSLDNGISDLNKASAQLKIYRQAVLKKAFTGVLTKEWRAKQTNLPSASELLQQIQAERQNHHQQQLTQWQVAVQLWQDGGKEGKRPTKPRALKKLPPLRENELQKLPDNWNLAKLANITDLIGGVTKGRKLPNHNLASLPYLRVANVQDGYLNLDQIKYIETLPSDLDKYLLVKGDILYTEGGDKDKLGRGTIWNNEIEDCIHQNHIFRARLFSKGFTPKFVNYYSQTKGAKLYFYSNAKQTTNLASINLTVLSNLPIPLCSLPEQLQIVQKIESRLSVCDNIEQTITVSLEKAEALRQSILKKAFAGELLNATALAACRQEADWQPASELLKQIKATQKP